MSVGRTGKGICVQSRPWDQTSDQQINSWVEAGEATNVPNVVPMTRGSPNSFSCVRQHAGAKTQPYISVDLDQATERGGGAECCLLLTTYHLTPCLITLSTYREQSHTLLLHFNYLSELRHPLLCTRQLRLDLRIFFEIRSYRFHMLGHEDW